MQLALTPPMGWNSWNSFGRDINADIILETADAIINTGLANAGYQIIVIDDFWEADERVDGRLTWDPKKFPDGIPALVKTIHSKRLKLGIYSCAGSHTCGGKPGSYGYEEIDAQTFAEWGVDYLKYDYCHTPPGTNAFSLYQRMGQALRATNRPIIYSVCEWGKNQPWQWGAKAGAQLWRTCGDIMDNWESILKNGFLQSAGLEAYAGPGHWNDPDMLIVGMYGKGNADIGLFGCTDAEYQTHFSLWSLLAAPLMIGCDVRKMNQATQEILLNKEVIAINQDPLGCQGFRVGETLHADETAEVWIKPLADGSLAVGCFNLGERDQRQITVAWETIGLNPDRQCQVRDLWENRNIGVFKNHFSVKVDKHAVKLLKISPEL